MKNFSKYTALLICFFFVCHTKSKAQFYNGSFQEFGKNRVQEVTFFWQYYDFQRFRVFFYGNGKEHAQFVARSAHKSLQELELYFETTLDSKIDILVFNKQSDFRQSNIGLTNDISSNVGGKNTIIGNKMFVYFEDDHSNFEHQIRASLSQVIVNKLIYQGNWKKVVRSSSKVDLPEWFSEGLYSYIGQEWSPKINNIVKDGVLRNIYDKLGRLKGEEAKYAGHAMWNYIAQVYGEGVIPQIIYLVSISRNFESSFRFVIGKSAKTLNQDFTKFYKNKYKKEEEKKLPLQEEIKIKRRKKKGKITQFKISPDGTKLAYSTNDLGKYYIWIYDISNKKYTKVLKRGYKIERKADETYPLIDWHPSGNKLAFVEERHGSVFLNYYDLESKETEKVEVQRMSKINSFSYNHKGNQIVFSGLYKGFVDLYLYNVVGNGYLRLTNDIYDEINPSFIENSTKIIFSSNRKNDSLFLKTETKPFDNKYDIYIYELNKKFQKTLLRVTNTPEVNETKPFELEKFKYTFLSDYKGTINRSVAVFDSTISAVDTVISYRYYSKSSILTDYKRSVLDFDYVTESKKTGMLLLEDGKYKLYVGDNNLDKMLAYSDENLFENNNFLKKKSTVEIISIKKVEENKNKIKTDNYRFEEEKPKKKRNKENDLVYLNPENNPQKEKTVLNEKFKLPTQRLYNINFTLDEFTTRLDKNFINKTYQLFNPSSPIYNNTNINVFTLVQMKDLMEDYRLIGGVNLSFTLQDNDYVVSYEDLAQRIDKKYLFVRQAYSDFISDNPVKTRTHEFKYRLKYPFSEVSALSLTLNVRNDNVIFSSVDRGSLESKDQMTNLGGAKLEYIFDNTFDRGLNLYEGTRLKLFGEYYQELFEKKTDFFVVGADIRHYIKIHRELTFATRFAASTSFGNKKLVYYMGGVDGWLSPRRDNNVIIPLDRGFAYQSLATPMRGFLQTTRFGNSFAVSNTELRWPIFRYFSEYPIQSRFLSTFQIIGFGDVGTAWTGSNPYSKENSFNYREVTQKPIKVTIQNQREPIIFGYGFGFRAEIFGYFIRYDRSWGIEDGVNKGLVNYFSISLDF